MAAKKSKSVTATLSNPSVKKSVTRFDATSEGEALQSVYVNREALKSAFGTDEPKSITVTITV
jgi:hypothetical protein